MDTPIVAEIDPPHRTQTRPRSAKIKNMGGPVTSNLDVCMLCDQSKYKLKKKQLNFLSLPMIFYC